MAYQLQKYLPSCVFFVCKDAEELMCRYIYEDLSTLFVIHDTYNCIWPDFIAEHNYECFWAVSDDR